MIKKINKKFLQKNNACPEGIKWFLNNNETDTYIIITKLIKDKHLDWTNWLITHLMNKKQRIQYAIFAAESIIKTYEKKYPKNGRPRKAIQAAKDYLKNPYEKTKDTAYTAYVYTAYIYADAYAYTDAYAYAYVTYANIATYVAIYAIRKKLKIKILNYGIKLLSF